MPEKTPIELESEDGTPLRGEMLSPASPRALVVLCHGIPLSRPDPSDGGYPELAQRISDRGYGVLYVNFRGTGDSGGDFSLAGWYSDLAAVMGFAADELSRAFPGLVMAGFSAGGALAIRHAAECGGVAGVATFAAPADFTKIFPREHLFALLELAKDVGIIRRFDFPPDPFEFYAELESFAAIDFVSRVSPIPLMLVHGDEDEMVPVEEGVRLFEAARDPRELVVLSGGGHRLRQDPRSLECLTAWLDGLEV
jgi:fermentation-respiration switch protein FrsA (DUF1100 family)